MIGGPVVDARYYHFTVVHNRYEDGKKVEVTHLHRHNVGELMLVSEGRSLISCDGKIVSASAPYIVYYPAGIPHVQDNRASDWYERWCFPVFPADIGCPPELPADFFVIHLTDEQCERFKAYAGMMHSCYGAPNDRWVLAPIRKNDLPALDAARLKYLLLLFINELQPLIPDEDSVKSSYINDVCVYITEHITEQLPLDMLADRFFVGRTKLTGDFRRTMGMSIVEFITAVRVNRAKTLLEAGLPLSEIAEQCGFSSVSYFIKVFTRCTGLSPKQYRDALKGLLEE